MFCDQISKTSVRGTNGTELILIVLGRFVCILVGSLFLDIVLLMLKV